MKTVQQLREEKQRMEAEILERVQWFQKEYGCEIDDILLTSMEKPNGDKELIQVRLKIKF